MRWIVVNFLPDRAPDEERAESGEKCFREHFHSITRGKLCSVRLFFRCFDQLWQRRCLMDFQYRCSAFPGKSLPDSKCECDAFDGKVPEKGEKSQHK